MNFFKPEMKPMLIPFIKEDGTGIIAGGFQVHISRFIKSSDPQELYKFLLSLDGNNTLHDLSMKFKLSIEKINTPIVKSSATQDSKA